MRVRDQADRRCWGSHVHQSWWRTAPTALYPAPRYPGSRRRRPQGPAWAM